MTIETLLEAHMVQDAANFDELREEVKVIRADVAIIKQQLGQWKGFFGGIVFVLSALWAVITWGLPWLRH